MRRRASPTRENMQNESQPTAANGRSIKFTPERFEQIRNLVERGISREQIADTIGVTVGSLQVTCSRHGISLKRPKLNNGVYYRWRQEFGGLKTGQVKRLKDLELENSRLRKAVSDLTLDKLILQEAARGNF